MKYPWVTPCSSLKAPKCMSLEIGCSCTILQVLVAANTLLTLSLAVLGGTPKKMVLAPLIISNINLHLKESIYGRMPASLEMSTSTVI